MLGTPPVRLDPVRGVARLGDFEVPVVAVGSDGALQVGGAGGHVLRPITFGERSRLAAAALGQSGPREAICSAILEAATVERGFADRTVLEILAAWLAGAGSVELPFAEAARLVAQGFGWGPAQLAATAAAEVDRLAGYLAGSRPDGGWNRIVIDQHEPKGLALIRAELADDLLRRAAARSRVEPRSQPDLAELENAGDPPAVRYRHRTSPGGDRGPGRGPGESEPLFSTEGESSAARVAKPEVVEARGEVPSTTRPLWRVDLRSPSIDRGPASVEPPVGESRAARSSPTRGFTGDLLPPASPTPASSPHDAAPPVRSFAAKSFVPGGTPIAGERHSAARPLAVQKKAGKFSRVAGTVNDHEPELYRPVPDPVPLDWPPEAVPRARAATADRSVEPHWTSGAPRVEPSSLAALLAALLDEEADLRGVER